MKSRFNQIVLAALVLLASAFCYVLIDTLREHNVEVGDAAPRFSVRTDNGQQISRASFGGKVLVLNFWATWCPPCIDEIPSLNAMQQTLKNNGVVVLAVSVDKDEQQYKQFLQRHRVSFLTYRDPNADISTDFGTLKYPETYIIDSNGKVVEKLISNQNWMDEALLSRIRKLL